MMKAFAEQLASLAENPDQADRDHDAKISDPDFFPINSEQLGNYR